jgi:hypothetical protein
MLLFAGCAMHKEPGIITIQPSIIKNMYENIESKLEEQLEKIADLRRYL